MAGGVGPSRRTFHNPSDDMIRRAGEREARRYSMGGLFPRRRRRRSRDGRAMTSLQVLGAARTVTGSKHLLEVDGCWLTAACIGGSRSCGSGTGTRCRSSHRRSNGWCSRTLISTTPGTCPGRFGAGSAARSSRTRATVDLLAILLHDSGRLQEEEAAHHSTAPQSTAPRSPRIPKRKAALLLAGSRRSTTASVSGCPPTSQSRSPAPATSRVRAAPQPPGRCSSCTASPGPHKRARGARDPGTGLVGRRASIPRSFHACVSAQTSEGRPVLHR